jgi:four helix bundle protein
MKIIRFEDIGSWQEGRKLCTMIYGITQYGQFNKDFGLRDQIRRAAVSVISNIAEGFDSKSNIEFHRFLIYARRSISELKSQLYVALDVKYISRSEFDTIYMQAEKTAKLTNGFVRFLSQHKKSAPKSSNENLNKLANKQTIHQ